MKPTAHLWYKMPLLRLLVPFIIGIFAYATGSIYYMLTGFAILFLTYNTRKHSLKSKMVIKGILLSAAMCATGYALCFLKDIRNKDDWFGKHDADQYIVRVFNNPTKGEYHQSMFAEVMYIQSNKAWKKSRGMIRVQVPLASTISKETVLLISKKPTAIPDTGSRKSYARYLANQQVFHQIKLKSADINIIDQPTVKEGKIEFLQRFTLEIMDKYFDDPPTRGLAKVLLVGYKGELDKEINTAYTNTGVVHVIAISGLHLGLIYGLLMLLFKPLQHIRELKITSLLIILIILWMFTLMCGATPSVVRSAVMFSFLILGSIIQSKSSTGNTLAASAFVMLVVNPFLIYDIGFQLSYAAVGSLLIYNKPISGIYKPENGFLKLGWSSISTSLAAQILTTPVVLFHFHQFPLIFILSNIIAIPLSSISLLLLILVSLFAGLPFIASFIAKIAAGCIRLMNERIVELATLPFSKMDNIPFTGTDLIFTYIFIALFTVYMRDKKIIALKIFLITLLIRTILYHYSSR